MNEMPSTTEIVIVGILFLAVFALFIFMTGVGA